MYLSDIKETARGTAYVSICQNFVKEDQSFVEAWEVIEYCKREGIDFRSFCLEKWGNEFACIPVLDYIIINTDRHTQNYGFMMNNDTGRLEAVAPMFDLNCALVADYFKRDAADTLSQMFNTKETIQKLAYDYVEHTDLRFNEKAFITLAQNHVYKELRHIFERVYGRVQEMGLA